MDVRTLLDAAPSALAAKVNPGEPDHSRGNPRRLVAWRAAHLATGRGRRPEAVTYKRRSQVMALAN